MSRAKSVLLVCWLLIVLPCLAQLGNGGLSPRSNGATQTFGTNVTVLGGIKVGVLDSPSDDFNYFDTTVPGTVTLKAGSGGGGGPGSETLLTLSDQGTGNLNIYTDAGTGNYNFGGFGGITVQASGIASSGSLTFYQTDNDQGASGTGDARVGVQGQSNFGRSLHLFSEPTGNIYLETALVVAPSFSITNRTFTLSLTVTNNMTNMGWSMLTGPVTNASTVYLPTNAAPFNYPSYSFVTGGKKTMTDKGWITVSGIATNTLATPVQLWVTNDNTHNFRRVGGVTMAAAGTNYFDTAPMPFSIGDVIYITNMFTPAAGVGVRIDKVEISTGP